MENKKLNKTIGEIFESKYIVPLYQRNFAWRKEQIEQLLQDIYEAFRSNADGFYYIGSLIVLQRHNGDYEVIDGQQRLTVLSLITKILKINNSPRLVYDSRPEVEEFFKAFYHREDSVYELDDPQISHLKNAIGYIYNAPLDANAIDSPTIARGNIGKFNEYFRDRVILILVEIPQDTDVASYFEIMNNRGEQLQKHEILKSLIISKLKDEKGNYNISQQKQFAEIWDACSQMDIPIQKCFGADKRSKYFGNNYASFHFNGLDNDSSYQDIKTFSIEKILDPNFKYNEIDNTSNMDDNEDADESIYKSIIDFPNFLMHILRMYYNDTYRKKQKEQDIPLNEKYLLKVYNVIKDEIEPNDFISKLFHNRTAFDNYIIKTTEDIKDEDGIKWTLKCPKRYDKNWKYVDTFGKNIKDADDDENRTDCQRHIIKTLSMLQVTFRTRIYKKWLQDVLSWLTTHKDLIIKADDYQTELDRLSLEYYNERKIKFTQLPEGDSITKDNAYALGRNTPHFIFNFIDYLYWVESLHPSHDIAKINDVHDFDFKYWNSVEHHLAVQKVKGKNGYENYIDNLGNLCLISKNINSKLNDRDVKEKVEYYSQGNLGANRQIIYATTKDNNFNWGIREITSHYNDLLDLLNKRFEILNLNNEIAG